MRSTWIRTCLNTQWDEKSNYVLNSDQMFNRPGPATVRVGIIYRGLERQQQQSGDSRAIFRSHLSASKFRDPEWVSSSCQPCARLRLDKPTQHSLQPRNSKIHFLTLCLLFHLLFILCRCDIIHRHKFISFTHNILCKNRMWEERQ